MELKQAFEQLRGSPLLRKHFARLKAASDSPIVGVLKDDVAVPGEPVFAAVYASFPSFRTSCEQWDYQDLKAALLLDPAFVLAFIKRQPQLSEYQRHDLFVCLQREYMPRPIKFKVVVDKSKVRETRRAARKLQQSYGLKRGKEVKLKCTQVMVGPATADIDAWVESADVGHILIIGHPLKRKLKVFTRDSDEEVEAEGKIRWRALLKMEDGKVFNSRRETYDERKQKYINTFEAITEFAAILKKADEKHNVEFTHDDLSALTTIVSREVMTLFGYYKTAIRPNKVRPLFWPKDDERPELIKFIPKRKIKETAFNSKKKDGVSLFYGSSRNDDSPMQDKADYFNLVEHRDYERLIDTIISDIILNKKVNRLVRQQYLFALCQNEPRSWYEKLVTVDPKCYISLFELLAPPPNTDAYNQLRAAYSSYLHRALVVKLFNRQNWALCFECEDPMAFIRAANFHEAIRWLGKDLLDSGDSKELLVNAWVSVVKSTQQFSIDFLSLENANLLPVQILFACEMIRHGIHCPSLTIFRNFLELHRDELAKVIDSGTPLSEEDCYHIYLYYHDATVWDFRVFFAVVIERDDVAYLLLLAKEFKPKQSRFFFLHKMPVVLNRLVNMNILTFVSDNGVDLAKKKECLKVVIRLCEDAYHKIESEVDHGEGGGHFSEIFQRPNHFSWKRNLLSCYKKIFAKLWFASLLLVDDQTQFDDAYKQECSSFAPVAREYVAYVVSCLNDEYRGEYTMSSLAMSLRLLFHTEIKKLSQSFVDEPEGVAFLSRLQEMQLLRDFLQACFESTCQGKNTLIKFVSAKTTELGELVDDMPIYLADAVLAADDQSETIKIEEKLKRALKSKRVVGADESFSTDTIQLARN